MLRIVFACFLGVCLFSCRPQTFTPKPAGYYKIDTPAAHTYQLFDRPGFPYTFEYPVYCSPETDSTFLQLKADNPYWLNLSFPGFNAKIFLTYRRIANNDSFMKMVQDSYGYSFFHHEKADYIHDDEYTNRGGLGIMLYTIGGNAASSYQFTITDTTKNFMRGALYFDVTPNADSLKPANDFLIQDIRHMLATLRFR